MQYSKYCVLSIIIYYLLHKLLQLLIYFIFGISYSFFNPFTLTLHNLEYKSSNPDNTNISINIETIRLHLSLFKKSNYYAELSISNVILNLKGLNENLFDLSSEENASNSNNSKSSNCLDSKFIKSLNNQNYDPNAPVIIYPNNNNKLKRLIKFFIKSMPHLSFIINQSKILITSELSINCKKIIGKTDINKSITKNSFLKKLKNSNHIWISSLQLYNCNLINIKSNQSLSNFFTRCETSITFQLDINSGIASSLQPVLRILEMDISIIYLLKLIKSINPNFQFNNNKNNSNSQNDIKIKKIHKYKLYIYGFVFRLLKNASISLQSLNISDIPLTNLNNLNNYLNNSKYLDDDEIYLENFIFLTTKIASFSLDIGPVNPNQVGYSLKFVEGSLPLQWIYNLSNLKFTLNYSKIKNYNGKIKDFDVLFIPNLLFTMESTMMINLLRVVFNNYIQDNFTKKQTITTIQMTVANPSLDISAEQLSILMKIFKEKDIKDNNNKQQKQQQQQQEISDTLKEEYKNRKLDYKNIILNTSPKFQIKIFLEKPLAIIKSENEIIENKDIHLSTFQPSMISLQFDITTVKNIMNFAFRCDIPDTSMIYQRNNLNKTATSYFSIKDIHLKISFQFFNFSKLWITFNIGGLSINLTNLEVINGLSILYNSLKFYSLKNKPIFKQNHQINSKSKFSLFDKSFKDLPSWFSTINISLKDINITIGSKSLFFPAIDLLDEMNEYNNFLDEKVYSPSSVSFKINSIELNLKNKSSSSSITETGDNSSTSYSENSKTPDDYYWFISSKISNTQIYTKIMHPDYEVSINERILKIPQFDSTLYCLKTKLFEFSNIINTIDISHSVSSHFTIFSAFYLMKTAILHHKFNLENENIVTKSNTKSNTNNPIIKKNLLNIINIKWYLKEMQFKMIMPQNFHLRIDLFDFKGFANNNAILMEKKLIRVFIKKDPKVNYFNRFITFDNIKTICKFPNENDKLMKISITDQNIKFSIPSNFIVHSFFDAIILTLKLSKKFIKSLKSGPTLGLDKISSTGIINLPKIKIKSETLAISIDDDPFESELGMIYQLGILEQKNRLEKEKYFNQFIDNIRKNSLDSFDTDEKLNQFNELLDNIILNPVSFDLNIEDIKLNNIINDCSRKLHKLRTNISKSWIILVNEYKLKKKAMVSANTKFISQNIISSITPILPFNSKIIDFDDNPPLMALLFNDLIISIKPPSFDKDSGDVHKFLNRIGKGVPLDTNWDKIIPLNMNIKACEVRVHLRDFPLPFVYIPNYKSSKNWSDSFNLNSTLVIAEPMPISDQQYWYINIPMYDCIQEGSSSDVYYSWQAPKTITTVKSYYEIECNINSDNSTLVTWSTSYQAVLRQLNICFDTFSKATNDPSPKLGVWDKLRNIMHGYFKINWINENSEVCINILNTQDPYQILGINAGFSLIFKNDVRWIINDPEREFERDYFIFRSKSVLFGIPNYLCQPLPCWCTRKLIFLPSDIEDLFVTSLFGYYLNSDLYLDDNNIYADNMLELASINKFKTHNIYLNGDIELKLTMIFERKLEDGTKTMEFKSHFENILTSSHLVKDSSNFDSYKGFRSDFIHAGLALSAKNSIYNILRLTPRSLFHFKKWFKQFSDDIGLPIKNGNLWAAKNESVELGSHLMTFKFMFDVEPLYIYHGYRVDLIKPDNHTLIGLKAKIDSFKCDLHQRKEKKIKHIEFLNQNYDVMKMTFYIGKIDLNEIDLRVIGLKFSQAKDDDEPLHKFEIFDDDQDWIDVDDYEEVDIPALRYSDIDGQIHPLLYATHFCYWMDKKFGENEFGNEDSHNCYIKPDEFPKSKFHHIFDTDKLKFKWYPHVRNLLFEYIAGIEFRNAYIFSTSYSSVNEIKNKLAERVEEKESISENTKSRMLGYQINSEEEFKKAMRDITDYFKSTIAVDHMLLRFSDVQIQLMASPEQEQLILFRVQHNEVEIISLMDKDWYRYVNSANIAKRFGTIFQNADLLIISKKEYNELGKTNNHYGSNNVWPAFLDGDEPEEFIKNKTLLSNVLIYLIMEKTSNSYAGGKRRNKLYVNIPNFETKIDSESYITFFNTIQHLLVYSSPQQKQFAEMTEALELATGDMDKQILLNDLQNSSYEIKQLMSIYRSLSPQRCITEGETYTDSLIRQKCTKLFSNTLILSKLALMSFDTISEKEDDNCFMEWVISAANINIKLIDNDHSFLNFIMKDCFFSRLEMLDKSTINQICLKTIKILNTDYNILYPELLISYKPDSCFKDKYHELDNMVKIDWELGEKVGGMHNIKNVEISCHPMKISMEDTTGIKLMRFLFPKEVQSDESQSDGSNNSNSDDDNNFYNEYDDSESSYDDENDKDDKDDNDDNDDNEIVDKTYDNEKHLKNHDSEVKSDMTKPNIKIDNVDESSEERELALKNGITNEYLNVNDEDDKLEQVSLTSNGSTRTQKGSQYSKKVNTKSNIVSKYSKTLNKRIVDGKILNTADAVDNLSKMGFKGKDSVFEEGSSKSMSILEISERAKLFFAVGKFVFNDFLLNVTFSGKGKLRLINVNNLTIVVPSFGVKKKIWTSVDMINAIKKHIIKTLIKQTGRLIKNKLFIHKRKKRVNKLERLFKKK